MKSLDASDNVNRIVAVSPAVSSSSSALISRAGAVVSGGTVFTSRLIDVRSALMFPAASRKAPRTTVITPSSVLFSAGVKLAL